MLMHTLLIAQSMPALLQGQKQKTFTTPPPPPPGPSAPLCKRFVVPQSPEMGGVAIEAGCTSGYSGKAAQMLCSAEAGE